MNFEPRLVVSIGNEDMNAQAGERDGAEIMQGDGSADWNLPAGSVVELKNDANSPKRVLITRQAIPGAPLDEAPVWPTPATSCRASRSCSG